MKHCRTGLYPLQELQVHLLSLRHTTPCFNEACGMSMTSSMTHHDAKSFQDVEFAHGTGAVFVQPGVHTHFMEDVSA